MSLAGWITFLCVLPIFHPRWVASSYGDALYGFCLCFGSTPHTNGCRSNDGIWFGYMATGPPIGGRLPNGKNGED